MFCDVPNQLSRFVVTMEILNRDTDKIINFQGMLVGNPFVDPFSNTLTQIRSFYSHGLLPKPLFDEWDKECTALDTYDTPDCQKKEYAMFKGLYGKINPYALDYPICIEDKAIVDDYSLHRSRRLNTHTSSQTQQLLHYASAGGPPFLPTEDVYRPCSEEHLNNYLNREDVQQAIHVSPKAAKKWRDCSNTVHYSPQDFEASIIDLYKELIQRACIENDLQVFVFSGDDDSVCSTSGTQYWIYDLGVSPMADLFWKSWTVEGEVAGYVTQFELETPEGKGSFVFATVHGAGHEVPAYRPMEALEMFRRVLVKEW
jgi:carboxypeptidase C (cathepsin A)